MSATVTIGSWIVPLAITIVSVGWALTRPIGHNSYGMDIIPLVQMMCVIILSLFSWLMWAILT